MSLYMLIFVHFFSLPRFCTYGLTSASFSLYVSELVVLSLFSSGVGDCCDYNPLVDVRIPIM